VANQVVYVNKADSDFLGSSLYAVDADTGDRLWSWAAPSHVYQAPAISGGSVYVDDFTSHAGVIKLSLPPRQ
jgi:outer membrane protein assembly factor BamB